MTKAKNHAAGYSTTSEEMLCKTCKFGQVVESSQGGTAVMCHYVASSCEGAPAPIRLNFLVTKCNRYELPDVVRIWDTAIGLHIEDGHCWLTDQRYVPALGHVHQRADTSGRRIHVYREYPGREWDSAQGRFTDESKPIGHRLARWWRRLQG
jgi:hypothetical protein